jgi:hypothetical protein
MEDVRPDLINAFSRFSIVGISGDRYLTLFTQPVPRLIIFDLDSWRVICGVSNPIDGSDAVSAVVHRGGRYVTQRNRDGSIHVYSCPTGENVLDGAYVDDEIVLMERNGYFDGSDDAAAYVEITIPGLPGRHLLSQFAKNLKHTGLVQDVLDRHETFSPPTLSSPPSLQLSSSTGGVKLSFDAYSAIGVKYIEVYGDGRPIRKQQNSGGESETLTLSDKDYSDHAALTAIALDEKGYASAPIMIKGGRDVLKPDGQLFVLAVGINNYSQETLKLHSAAEDAGRIADAVGRSPLYTHPAPIVLPNDAASEKAIIAGIDQMVLRATFNDTIVTFFAGHGVRDNTGNLRLALSSTAFDKVEATALAFEAIAQRLRAAKARVVVLLDVCHAGLSEQAMLAGNDVATTQLMTNSGASMIILSASKGRQYSNETATGGLFSKALEQIIARNRKTYDTDGSGAISISELYRGVKSAVAHASNGQQTPWLSRNLMLGDFDLF